MYGTQGLLIWPLVNYLGVVYSDFDWLNWGSACGQGYSTSNTRFVSHPSLAEIVTWNRRRWTKTLEVCFTALPYHNGSKELACHILFMCLLYILGLLCLKVNKMIQWWIMTFFSSKALCSVTLLSYDPVLDKAVPLRLLNLDPLTEQ